jgi:hypothetical protein
MINDPFKTWKPREIFDKSYTKIRGVTRRKGKPISKVALAILLQECTATMEGSKWGIMLAALTSAVIQT